MSDIKDILYKLKIKYNVDNYFYSYMSLGIDSPDLEYEISNIINLLNKNNFETSLENIYELLKLKKHYINLCHSSILKNFCYKYKQNILEKEKPIGFIAPIEYIVASIWLIFILVSTKFLEGFSDELGRITAKKLTKTEKDIIKKETDLTNSEIELIENELTIIISNDEQTKLFRDKIKKLKIK